MGLSFCFARKAGPAATSRLSYCLALAAAAAYDSASSPCRPELCSLVERSVGRNDFSLLPALGACASATARKRGTGLTDVARVSPGTSRERRTASAAARRHAPPEAAMRATSSRMETACCLTRALSTCCGLPAQARRPNASFRRAGSPFSGEDTVTDDRKKRALPGPAG
eukprot:366416-Chlamydomonas_euryale.AAC.4